MESEYKKGSIGGFIANGYDCGSLKFNPYSSHQFIISITDEGLFIKNSRELEYDYIPKEYFKFTRSALDKLTNVVRFKITDGKYANEYVVESYMKNKKFPDIISYIELLE